jgi:hypothetical protein
MNKRKLLISASLIHSFAFYAFFAVTPAPVSIQGMT